MKIYSIFFLHLVFFGLFNGHHSFDSESVLAGNPEDNRKVQLEESQERAFIRRQGNGFYVLRHMRPFVMGSREVWRGIRTETLDTVQDLRRLRNAWWNFIIGQSKTRSTTEKSIINVNGEPNVDDNISQMPPNRVKESDYNYPEGSKTINSSPVIVEKEETLFEDDNLENEVTKSPNRVKETDNNDHERSETINSSPVIVEKEETIFEGDNIENEETKSPNSSPVVSEKGETEDDNLPSEVTKLPERLSPDSNFFAGIVNDFAFKLVETLNLESNFVISPLSIFVALSMCYLGADGGTKLQMEQALGMNANAVHGEKLHQGIKDLLSMIMQDSLGYKLFVANGMFLGENFTADAEFEEKIKEYYDAELANVDFGNPELSQRLINDWVSQNTENMIRKIINSPLSSFTRLILLNAVFFEGYWKIKFPLDLTYSGNFHSINGDEKKIPFMNILDETFPVLRSDEHKHNFLKLPYEGDQISMIIALPYSKGEIPMPSITEEILCDVRDAMVDKEFRTVDIPKFRLDYTTSLVESLQELGISDIFDSSAADLKKLRKENDVYVSDIMHKAVIRVDEAGTTASASTSIKFNPLSAGSSTSFIADHPFAFYIVHEASGLVLFYGKVFDFDADSMGNESTSIPWPLLPKEEFAEYSEVTLE